MPAVFCVLLQIPEKFGILNMYEKKQTKRNPQKNWKRRKFGIIVLEKKYEEEKMNKDGMKVDYDELDKIRERLLTDPSYNDIEITDTSLEEFLQEIESNPKIKFTTKGGIKELRERVAYEKKYHKRKL